jgi:signal peptidase I
MKTKKKYLLKILIISFFMSTGIFALFFGLIHNFFGYDISLAACSGSMEPTIKCGCLLLGRDYLFPKYSDFANYEIINKIKNDIKAGDIIYFQGDFGTIIIHRVLSVEESCVITKGDNNSAADGCIPFSSIIGKLIWKGC